MDKRDVFEVLKRTGVVPVIRTDHARQVSGVVEALEKGGIPVAEITMTIPKAIGLIAELAGTVGSRVTIGAGTVNDVETCRSAIEAGSRFIVTPTANVEVVRFCSEAGVCVIGGALTPTEVRAVWEAGATGVKIFPASIMGHRYLAMLREPFPEVPLVPTGGITLDTLGQYLRAGAAFVGAGGDLVRKEEVASGDLRKITSRAEMYTAAIDWARRHHG